VFLAAGPILELELELAVTLILASLGTALGSVLRDRIVHRFRTHIGRADLGVLASNIAACVVAGVGTGLAATVGPERADTAFHALVALGFAGGLSTWSTLAIEVAGALRARRWTLVLLHIPVSFAVALGVFLLTRILAGGVR
jgi:CrcB protein